MSVDNSMGMAAMAAMSTSGGAPLSSSGAPPLSPAISRQSPPGGIAPHPALTPELRELGEEAVLRHGRTALISDIRGAVTTKYNQVFLLTSESGDILPTNQGFGLYFRDTRYLDQLELRIWGERLIPLLADESTGDQCHFELTNADIVLPDGNVLPKDRVSIHRRFSLRHGVQHEVILRSLAPEEVELDLTLNFSTQFTNMFVVRGTPAGKRGTLRKPQVQGNSILFSALGADGHQRSTKVACSPQPTELSAQHVGYRVHLAPREVVHIMFSIELEDLAPKETQAAPYEVSQTPATTAAKHQAFDEELADLPVVLSNNPLFDLMLARSLSDMRMLATAGITGIFLAAGVPWYVALFGRDSCISAYQMLAFQPAIARSTIAILAKYQGTQHNDFQDEEPGKILHELRVGEKANLHEVPQYPYYGSVDATEWFLILLGEYVQWTGDLDFFRQYQETAERALEWIDANPVQHELEFVAYGTKSSKGLINQGWKDSGNAIVNEDGSLAQPPIALVEVQGYVYAAKRALARLYRLIGNERRADALELQAEDLKMRFNARYWMPDKQFYGLAIQRNGVLSHAIASNPGQLLFTGIVDIDRATLVAKRLLADDMSSGWGIRTLSAKEVAYNPLDYQVGSVWPHDNALIALGLQRIGLDQQAEHVFTGIFEAAKHFTYFRLPEVYDGFGTNEYSRPVNYPVACVPQAWAAGAFPLMLTAALGFEPDAPNKTLRIHHPRLPAWLTSLTIRGVCVGQAKVDLRYERTGEVTLVGVLGRKGTVDVVIDY